MYSWSERRKAKQHKRAFTEIEVPTEYTARYSIQDRVIAVVMAAYFLLRCPLDCQQNTVHEGPDHITNMVAGGGF